MPNVDWEEPFCGEGASCYRVGTDDQGNSYIALAGAEDTFLADTQEALQQMIRDIKAGKADHLL
ncbi:MULTISPECIES: hypothetical protein [Streptomyces]|uniref:Uncharacterized protein n=1 Tax=Streptomyces clavifer TaxID=68188 RepID=A0ABS4V632_9ACTN|nr:MULTISPECIES: hypothetical protein [Streptomyces]MBP2359368.1 hypothetical protein [Streptomyces clavifer]MDX2744854.1 hypothetical protein [Streptomyces sp. NRRL_B-2557]RPK80612.1 hypothetical protein EES45_12765 [Streptomyces sp. ADI97-07]GHA80856.1 hypothetical protein GCM10010392_03350 [Streptomyces clavifer]